MLLSHKGRYLIRRSAVTLGRTTSTHGKVSRSAVCQHVPDACSPERMPRVWSHVRVHRWTFASGRLCCRVLDEMQLVMCR